jgi:hypothetical protein
VAATPTDITITAITTSISVKPLSCRKGCVRRRACHVPVWTSIIRASTQSFDLAGGGE